jgi:hypothetical protein
LGNRLLQRQFRTTAQFVLQRPAIGRGDEHFAAAGLTMPPGILARIVDIEFVMRVLDQRHGQPVCFQAGDHLFHQRGFAASGPAGEANDLHDRPDSRREKWR